MKTLSLNSDDHNHFHPLIGCVVCMLEDIESKKEVDRMDIDHESMVQRKVNLDEMSEAKTMAEQELVEELEQNA
mgnify:CR=1 FL=1